MFQRSRVRILIGHFSYIFFRKYCNDVSLKRPKTNDKRGRSWPIKKLFHSRYLKTNCDYDNSVRLSLLLNSIRFIFLPFFSAHNLVYYIPPIFTLAANSSVYRDSLQTSWRVAQSEQQIMQQKCRR